MSEPNTRRRDCVVFLAGARKGLPPYKSECVEKFRRGWLACQDVPPADRYAAMLKLLLEGKVVSYWCDVGGVEVTRFSGEG